MSDKTTAGSIGRHIGVRRTTNRITNTQPSWLYEVRTMRPTLLLSLAGIGIVVDSGDASAQTPVDTARMHSVQPPSALLTAPLGSTSVTGTATVSGTTVRIAWSGDEPRAQRGWSVRRGTCHRDEGPLSQPDVSVIVDASGRASGSVTLAAPLSTGTPAYVAIRSMPVDSSQSPVACGSLWDGSAPSPGVASATASAPMGGMDHSTMDHSTMNHAATPSTPTSSASGNADTMPHQMPPMSDSVAAAMMAIHMRMMADPVIRERAQTDPVLMRMMQQMPAMNSMSGMAMPSTTATTPAKPSVRPPAKSAAKKPAAKKPAAKPATKPTTTMPGMDHSKMPGMRKPPA